MAEDSTIMDKTADTLGVDSLIAVEMRSWLLKELGVDLPLLIIIGGNTIRQVLGACRARIDPAMTPLLSESQNLSGKSEVRCEKGGINTSLLVDPRTPVTPALVQRSIATSTPRIESAIGNDAEISETDAEDPSGPILHHVRDGGVELTAPSPDPESLPLSIRSSSDQGSSDARRFYEGVVLRQGNSSTSSEGNVGNGKSSQVIHMKRGAVSVHTVSDESPSGLADLRETKKSRRYFGRLLRSRRFVGWRKYL